MVLDGSVLDYRENPFKMEVELNYSVLVNLIFSSLSFKKQHRIKSVRSQMELLLY